MLLEIDIGGLNRSNDRGENRFKAARDLTLNCVSGIAFDPEDENQASSGKFMHERENYCLFREIIRIIAIFMKSEKQQHILSQVK